MKKIASLLMALTLTAASLAGCTSAKTPLETTKATETGAALESTSTAGTSPEETTAAGDQQAAAGAIRVGSLKGPTSMGLVSLMNTDSAANTYEFTMVTAADELVAMVASNKVDIALVPANIAGVLYNKTEGGISVIDINTLGVLSLVSSDTSIKSVADLKGKTIYLTGKGTVPDYVLRYLLTENGLSESDVTLEYKSEPTEVAALLKEKEGAVGLLPQPFVTVACTQNEALEIVLDLTKEWDGIQGEQGSQLITGVTIASKDFIENNHDKLQVFLSDHKASTEFALTNLDETAELIVKAGIIEKAPIAKQALPYCNITYMDGEEMKTALSGYLDVLYQQDPKSVGGTLPDDNFYYIAK